VEISGGLMEDGEKFIFTFPVCGCEYTLEYSPKFSNSQSVDRKTLLESGWEKAKCLHRQGNCEISKMLRPKWSMKQKVRWSR